MIDFLEMPKIARLSRACTITEKIDGTNASIYISADSTEFLVGSRSTWITPDTDNHGFARWAYAHKEELITLGPGHHFGEWWGLGIQRNYGLAEKRFSLFNTHRWSDSAARPACCGVVPVLYEGIFDMASILAALDSLRLGGSVAAPGFMNPEGIVGWHHSLKCFFKKTIFKDEKPKSSKEE